MTRATPPCVRCYASTSNPTRCFCHSSLVTVRVRDARDPTGSGPPVNSRFALSTDHGTRLFDLIAPLFDRSQRHS